MEVKEEGEVEIWSWGAGTEGQLGTAKLQDEYIPQHLPSSLFSTISTLSCGGAHVLALTSRGSVLTWGRGTSGQLGHGEMVNCLYPKTLNFLEACFITHVSAGWSHSGFVSDSGHLFTCGDGSFGQLGHGDLSSHCTPVKVSYFMDRHVGKIECGMRHSLVLLKDDSRNLVYAFGSGKRGQLGISTNKVKSVSVPQLTSGLEDAEIIAVKANGDHSAALSASGHLFTWGRGFSGASDESVPRCVSSSLQFIRVALGWNHALLLTANGEVLMLGGRHHGVLSDLEKMKIEKHSIGKMLASPDISKDLLYRVPGLKGIQAVEIAAGSEHSVVATGDGVIMTWGWGEHGQLGLSDTSDQINPQVVDLGCDKKNGDATWKVFCGSGFTFVVRSSVKGPTR